MRSDSTRVGVERVEVSTFTIPTVEAESDGTLTWDATTIAVVEILAGPKVGIGYAYAPPATACVIHDTLADVVTGSDAMAVGATWAAMVDAIRNQGRAGVVSAAISAVDLALWDLKGKLLGTAVVELLGAVHRAVPIYGSGGFTSFREGELIDQLQGWARSGIPAVKMKVGRDAAADIGRVAAVRAAIGDDIGLFVDANGAYSRKQALAAAERFAEQGVTWFEEPVSSDDLDGLRLVRDSAPPAWTSPPASTDTTSPTSAGCSRPERSTACRRT